MTSSNFAIGALCLPASSRLVIYDHATVEAVRRGWPVLNTHGTHLDPMLRPKETASAILQMASLLGRPTDGIRAVWCATPRSASTQVREN